MTAAGHPEPDLVELAFPYALDALTPAERAAVRQRRNHADRCTAAEFDATVAALLDTLAEIAVAERVSPPPGLEDRIQHAIDRMLGAALDRGASSAREPTRWRVRRCIAWRRRPH
ncbi:hypothetical protein LTV02_16790 [Nocardia yamanashiensis]|uniref:RskA family anti-sigma factor n=1 Tax=Nocardia yamanashiensis TaxID=209247 RepID=UPI001E2CFBBA|nr:hypothetical protein [Nocardia yamanashiensis]UGT44950.1 hypothetical protein LTV02_16790 [Nocardia yamanashiensis]